MQSLVSIFLIPYHNDFLLVISGFEQTGVQSVPAPRKPHALDVRDVQVDEQALEQSAARQEEQWIHPKRLRLDVVKVLKQGHE